MLGMAVLLIHGNEAPLVGETLALPDIYGPAERRHDEDCFGRKQLAAFERHLIPSYGFQCHSGSPRDVPLPKKLLEFRAGGRMAEAEVTKVGLRRDEGEWCSVANPLSS